MLRRTPAFATATVVTLALGIGAGTAIFSVVNTVLLRPLPYDDPDGIYRLRTMDVRGLPLGQVGEMHVTPLASGSGPVEVAAYGFHQESSIIGRDGLAQPVAEYFASARFFDVFKAPMLMGRGFDADDEPAMVLSHGLWRDVFQSDPGIVGALVVMNGSPRRVAGVAGAGFEFPPGTQVWTRIRVDPGPASAVLTSMDGYARLRPGATVEQLQAELDVLARRVGPWPDGHQLQFVPVPLLQDVVGAFGSTVLVLSGAAAILLLIACLNVASLLLTRGAIRGREIALRGALGAGWWRVVRQLVTETFVLCAAGGALGLALAAAAVRVARASGVSGVPRLDGLTIDGNVLLFTVACTLTTMLAVGAAPALRRPGGDLAGLVNGTGRSIRGVPRNRIFGAFVVAEVALAVILVIGAGLLVRSYIRLTTVSLGFNPDRLVTLTINVTGRIGAAGSDYLPVAQFYDELMDRIRAVPGIASVTAASHVPLQRGLDRMPEAPFLARGEAYDPRTVRQAQTFQVSADYFDVMGIRPVAGRLLQTSDTRDAPGAVVVNEAFARLIYSGRNAVGETIGFPGAALWQRGGLAFHLGVMAADRFEIVGVIPDIQQTTVWDEPQPAIYVPLDQWTVRRMAIAFRATSTADPRALIRPVRAELAAMDPAIPPVFDVYGDILPAATARQRLGTTLLVAFGLVSLGLAAVGLYGLMSYSVSQRTGEIAVRSALGARSDEVLWMIVAWALRLSLTGIVLGLASAWAMRAVVGSQLYEVSPLDPLVFGIVTVTTLAVAILSSYVPARRAAAIDPAAVLRAD